jgi:hypothetical protein
MLFIFVKPNCMKTKDIIKNLKLCLETDDFEGLDALFIETYSSEIPEEQEEKLSDILDEATLYLEFKEDEYKQEALKLISEL